MEWQPIEGAPKGEWLLLYVPNGLYERSYQVEQAPQITLGRYGAGDYQSEDWYSIESEYEFWDYGGMTGAGVSSNLIQVSPTHWMPLPDPPA